MASALTSMTPARSIVGRRRLGLYGLVALFLAALILFATGFPLVRMLQQALLPNGSFSTELWGRVFSGRGLGEAVMNTAILVVLCNLFCIPIAVTFAWLNERTNARMGVLSTFFPVVPLLLSAHDEAALQAQADRVGAALAGTGQQDLASTGRTLAVGRAGLPHRAVVVASTVTEAVDGCAATFSA